MEECKKEWLDGWMTVARKIERRTLDKLVLEKRRPSTGRISTPLDPIKKEPRTFQFPATSSRPFLFRTRPESNSSAPSHGRPLLTALPAWVSGQEFGCRTSSAGT